MSRKNDDEHPEKCEGCEDVGHCIDCICLADSAVRVTLKVEAGDDWDERGDDEIDRMRIRATEGE